MVVEEVGCLFLARRSGRKWVGLDRVYGISCVSIERGSLDEFFFAKYIFQPSKILINR